MLSVSDVNQKLQSQVQEAKIESIIIAISLLVVTALTAYAIYYSLTHEQSTFWQRTVYVLSAFGFAGSIVGLPISLMIIRAAIFYKTPQISHEFYSDL